MSRPSKIIVVGGSGNIGRLILLELLKDATEFSVSTLTRPSSKAAFDSSINIVRAEYSLAALTDAFQGQDIVICTIGTYSLGEQMKIVQAAVAAGVKRYIPAEFGLDTSDPKALDVAPCLTIKTDIVKYLREHEDIISWTAILNGLWIDMTAVHTDWPWWSVQDRKMTIFDDGNTPFEGTTVAQAARATVKSILPQNLEHTKNKYVYVRSTVWTQNQLLKSMQKYTNTTDDDWKFDHVSVPELAAKGQQIFRDETSGGKKADDLLASQNFQGAVGSLITAALMGNGGINQFGEKPEMWMDRLGLKEEDPDNVVRVFVEALKA